MQLIIGTYTEQLPHVHGKASGILTASFDEASGSVGRVTTAATARNPSYLALSATGKNLYAVSETDDFEGRPGGGIAAYARDPATGGLALLNTAASLGPAPCYVALDRTERFVLTANYGTDAGSVTVYQVGPDGRLGNLTDHVEHSGSGPVPVRQTNSHAHMIASDPVSGAVLVTDLGSDAVMIYTLDDTGRLRPGGAARLAAAPGAGPRHLAFHPDGRHLFVVNELDNTVCVLRREGDGFTSTDRISTLPATASGQSLAGAIRVTPSGRHVLVSNRGHDSVAVLRFDASVPALTLLGHVGTPGQFPRDLVVTPDGRHVIVACQDSDLLATYRFDDDTGKLSILTSTTAPTPVCLLFRQLRRRPAVGPCHLGPPDEHVRQAPNHFAQRACRRTCNRPQRRCPVATLWQTTPGTSRISCERQFVSLAEHFPVRNVTRTSDPHFEHGRHIPSCPPVRKYAARRRTRPGLCDP